MRWFGGGDGDQLDEAGRQRQEASRRSLERGGLPLNAVDRLTEQASRQGTDEHFFTSDLSVKEALLVWQAGYDPLGQVMGSSVYHIGWQRMPNWSGSSRELEVLTQAFYHARHLALGRLRQEAQLLGATGVVGVRLERKEYEWGSHLLEFAAIGTAIREKDVPLSSEPPFLSDLSGEEFWMLRRAGYRPVGVAVGNCTYYQVPTWRTQNVTQGGIFGGGWTNQELPDYTQALYNARSLAMSRMEAEARSAGSEGVVGVYSEVEAEPRHVEVNDKQTRIDMIYHFTAIGTAISSHPAPPAFSVDKVISL
jgi:uncharacterized protein YbjQ (UPF0145 family)